MRRRTWFAFAVACAFTVMCARSEIPNDGSVPLPGRGGAKPLDAGAPQELSDGAPVEDAGDTADASCDKDQDGYKAMGACGGDDCDDDDSRAFPDAGFSSELATARTGGDWDCNGTVETQYPANTSCTGSYVGCPARTGFTASPNCGEAGAFDVCQPASFLCHTVTTQVLRQGCR